MIDFNIIYGDVHEQVLEDLTNGLSTEDIMNNLKDLQLNQLEYEVFTKWIESLKKLNKNTGIPIKECSPKAIWESDKGILINEFSK